MKIISGGQTGVDRAALDWAIARGIDHGGWCPLNRRALDGPIPNHYQLCETKSEGYSRRTKLNVQDSDGTLVLSRGSIVGGSLLTKRFASELGKPALVVDLDLHFGTQATLLQGWLLANRIQALNVAGPSESRFPGIYELAKNFLSEALQSPIVTKSPSDQI